MMSNHHPLRETHTSKEINKMCGGHSVGMFGSFFFFFAGFIFLIDAKKRSPHQAKPCTLILLEDFWDDKKGEVKKVMGSRMMLACPSSAVQSR